MSEHESEYGREVRDTIVKSSLTGVVATALVATVFSPAVLGGMVGVAQGFGAGGPGAQANDPYANLPPFPAPLSAEEVTTIRTQLERTAASLELTRAATEEKIEHIRSIAVAGNAVTFEAPRVALNTPVTAEPVALRGTLAAPEPVAEPAPLPQPEHTASGAGGRQEILSYREQHLEFADLLLSY